MLLFYSKRSCHYNEIMIVLQNSIHFLFVMTLKYVFEMNIYVPKQKNLN